MATLSRLGSSRRSSSASTGVDQRRSKKSDNASQSSSVASSGRATQKAGCGQLGQLAEAAVVPPWATPLRPSGKGLTLAAEALQMRRYQPTYADFGLAWRFQNTSRVGQSSSRRALIRPQAAECAPSKETDAERYQPNSADFGWWHAEQQQATRNSTPLARSTSSPGGSLLLDGKYEHNNPFTASFARRSPGGVIFCDGSVTSKP